MVKKLFKPHVKPGSVRWLLAGLAVLIVINLLARFGVVDITVAQSNILTIIAALFLMSEVSVFAILRRLRKGKVNVLDAVIGIVALLAIIGAATGLVGWTIGFLLPIQGIVEIGLLIFVFVEIFRKN